MQGATPGDAAGEEVGGGGDVVMVRRASVAACLTCPLCGRLLRDATTISECLHTCESPSSTLLRSQSPRFLAPRAGEVVPTRQICTFARRGVPTLPQLPAKYLRIKDVDLPASIIQKYLAQKLNLSSETELHPNLTLKVAIADAELCFVSEPSVIGFTHWAVSP
uniref:Uncharacterized protein n=1 Tax=Oryza sativa subsp. japonica TaxID=39947 RepID=Q7Y1H7_ORYSJ|nr:hypothetical protein [Oryza sativa Japonica Group]